MRRATRATRRVATLTVVAALAVSSACTDSSPGATTATTPPATSTTTSPKPRGKGPLRLGVVLPLTGPAASFGPPLIAGVDLAVQQINAAGGVNGEPISLVRLDEGKDLETLGQNVLDGDLDAIVGPAQSGDALSIAETVNQLEVATCTPTAGSVALTRYGNQYVFRTMPSDALQGAALARAINRSGLGVSGPSPVALLYPDDDYGRPIAERLRTELNPRVATVKYSSSYTADATDAELDAIASQVVGNEPSVAVVIGLPDGGGRMLARLRNTAGYGRISRIYVSDAMRQPNLFEKVAPGKASALANVQGVSPLADPLLPRFAAALRAINPDAGIAFAAYAYDCVNLIALAAQAAKSNDPRVFRERLVDVSRFGVPCDDFASCADKIATNQNVDYDGVSGPVDLDANGDVTSARYELFGFDESGRDVRVTELLAPAPDS